MNYLAARLTARALGIVLGVLATLAAASVLWIAAAKLTSSDRSTLPGDLGLFVLGLLVLLAVGVSGAIRDLLFQRLKPPASGEAIAPTDTKGDVHMAAKNIYSSSVTLPDWDPSDPKKSLLALYDYVEQQARNSIRWYYWRKSGKSTLSQVLRYTTVVLGAAGGLLPVIAVAIDNHSTQLMLNQIGYLSIGLAALALALDRFSGSSSGWMRYIAAAMALETIVEQLRLDREQFLADLGTNPVTPELAEKTIASLRATLLAVRAVVKDETDKWLGEFQANLAQLEQDTKEAWTKARDESKKDLVEERKRAEDAAKAVQAARDSTLPGGIDLEVRISGSLDQGYSVDVDGKLYRQNLTGPTCGIVNLEPGIHEVLVTGTASGKKLQVSRVITVPANKVEQLAVELK